MGDLKLFRMETDRVVEVNGGAAGLEKSLQTLMERNLEALLGVRFLATEFDTGPKHGGRIDTLGLDENGCPVIIEYKRTLNQNVINQGLFYLDWLLDHRGDFELLVLKTLGQKAAEKIDWSAPRLICVAADFTRYDEHAVGQIQRNIELIRYRRFENDLLLLELINAVGSAPPNTDAGSKGVYKTVSETLQELSGPLRDLYEEVRSFNLNLGDDVQERMLKYYVAFKRIRNFCCVEIHPQKNALTLFLKLDPDHVKLKRGFTRDMRKVGHYGTGDLEVTLRNRQDLEEAKPLIVKSFESA